MPIEEDDQNADWIKHVPAHPAPTPDSEPMPDPEPTA